MSVKYEFLFVTFAILFAITMEVRIEGFTSPAKPDVDVPHQNGSQATDNVPHQNGSQATDNVPHQKGSHVTGNVPDQNESDVTENDHSQYNGPTRWRDIFTTPGYESWWLTTTRKPRRRVYHKDYPAGVGVPSWREVSPGTSLFSLHNAKPSKPTAASVSGGSYIAFNFQIALNSFCVAFLLFCFCWP